MMRLATGLVVGAACICMTAADKPVTKPRTARAIGISVRISDWLLINADGSGIVGYGAGPPYMGHFKAGTFDVELLAKELRALPVDDNGKVQTHYSFGFASAPRGPAKTGNRYFTLDQKLIPQLFDRAIAASGKKKSDFPVGFGQLKPAH